MNLAAQDIAHYLKQHPLPAVTLIYGSEALLNSEALDAARARALADGYDERQRLYGDSRIDSLIQELETPSLFAPKRLLELHLDAKKTDKATSDTLRRLAELRLENSRLIIFAPNLDKPHTTAWYKALFSQGNLAIASAALYPPQFAKQIAQRLQEAKLRLTEAAYELLVANCQGNLFAAKQAIERLTIHPQAQNIIDDTLLTELLDDFSQFNTFALSDAILGADWPKAHRIACKRRTRATPPSSPGSCSAMPACSSACTTKHKTATARSTNNTTSTTANSAATRRRLPNTRRARCACNCGWLPNSTASPKAPNPATTGRP